MELRRLTRRHARAVALVVALAAAGGGTAIALVLGSEHSDSTPLPSETTTSNVVAWAPIAYDGTPPAVPGAVAHPDRTPWCTAAQLSPLKPSFQGATGSAAGAIEVRNVGSSACALQGVPALTGYDKRGHVVAVARAVDSFQLHPWVVVPPHAVASALIQIFGDESRCIGPVSRLVIDIGRGQPPFSITPTWVDGGGVQPRCGSDKPSRLRDTYDISVGEWRHRNGGPRLDGSDADAEITGLPGRVRQGGILRYRVTLTGLPASPCLPFRESLRGAYGADLTEQTFMVDCEAITALPGGVSGSVVLEMRLVVPTTTPPGDAELTWELPIGVRADAPSDVHILASRTGVSERGG